MLRVFQNLGSGLVGMEILPYWLYCLAIDCGYHGLERALLAKDDLLETYQNEVQLS